MASSQVEIVSSSSPFGCVLRNHNHRDPCYRETNTGPWRDLGGVSSLVQRWRDFESEVRSLSSNNSPVCNNNSNRSNSTSTFVENVSTSFSEFTSRNSDDPCESVDERYKTPTMHEDSFPDWESDRTGTSSPGRTDSNETERERLRVADIIRRLTCSGEDNSNDHEQAHGVFNKSLPRVLTPLDQSCFSPVLNLPRIRGRQAFSDLIMQMERDRHKELEGLVEHKAVSRFSQRGRIQALLRVRLLRRGAEGTEVRGRQDSISMASESNRQTQGSSIMHLREKFNIGVEHGTLESRNSTRDGSRSPSTEVIDNNSDAGNSSTSKQFRDNHSQQEIKTTILASTLQVQNLDVLQEEANRKSDVRSNETSHEVSNLGSQECTEKATSFNGCEYKRRDAEMQESDNQQLIGTSHDLLSDISHSPSDWMSDVSHLQSECEAQNYDYQEPDETNDDWIHDISRPRSDWEGLRQARYQEMLDPFSDNEDIRKLLQRKSVSTFLSSGLREQIDQLMMSRTQRAPPPIGKEEGEKDDVTEEEEEHEEVEDNDEDEYDDDVEDESQIRQLYNGLEDYANHSTLSFQLPLSSLSRPWSHNRDHKISDSEQVASPSLQQSISSNSLTQDNRQCSFFRDHSSIEMELIYDLRGQMEQLRQEMSELQRSIKSCMNMQLKLQRSTTQEVGAAVTHSAQKEGRDSLNRGPKKGNCCICYEMQIDSLLYRCGHMCTCFKCAYELQWSSGKCPICRAPIVDVVRARLES